MSLTHYHGISASLAIGIKIFIRGIELLRPRIYVVGVVRQKLAVVY